MRGGIRVAICCWVLRVCAAWGGEAAPVAVTFGMHNGRPSIFIGGRPEALPIYSPMGWSRPHFETSVPFFAEHGMGAYFVCMSGQESDLLWHEGRIDETAARAMEENAFTLRRQVEFILQRDPGARFFVRGLPIEAPRSWVRKHPDQRFVAESPEDAARYGWNSGQPSLASDSFWDDLVRATGAAIRHVEAQPYADRVLGYWAGMFHEGSHPPLYGYRLFDRSDPMRTRWRAFLRTKYGDEEALRAAHGVTNLTFETAAVPSDTLLGNAPRLFEELYWQGAAENGPRRDYLELTAQVLHEGYRRVFAEAHAASGGRALCLYDAFKQTMLGWNLQGFFDPRRSWWPRWPEMMTGGGYIGVADLFDRPGFDGLITPHDYQARGVGGVYEPEGIVDSMILRGKFFLCEMDTRTFNNPGGGHPEGDYGRARDIREYEAVTWRNLATSWTRGFTSYWMDLCGDRAGWFGSPEIHAVIARQARAIRESVHWKHEDVPGIAMVLDDSAVLETSGSGHYDNEAVMWEQKMGLARCGVPYRVYLFEDLALTNFPKHRVFYFPNLFRVNPERLELLREKAMRDGNVVVWGPGSGISDGTSIVLPPESGRSGTAGRDGPPIPATQLTGFEFHHPLPANCQRRVLVDRFDHPITAGLGADTIFGGPLAYGPAMYPREGDGAVSLGAAWTKQGRVASGLAVKSFGRGARGDRRGGKALGRGDWASVFTTAVPVPAALWRNLARYAGAHVYTDTGDILLADTGMVALHSIQSGRKTIRLPGRRRVTDVITGRRLDRRTDNIEFDLTAPETRVFLLE